MRRSARQKAIHERTDDGDQTSQDIDNPDWNPLEQYQETGLDGPAAASLNDKFDFIIPPDIQQQAWPKLTDSMPWSMYPDNYSHLAQSSNASAPVQRNSTDITSLHAEDDASHISHALDTSYHSSDQQGLPQFTNHEIDTAGLNGMADLFNHNTAEYQEPSPYRSFKALAEQKASPRAKHRYFPCNQCDEVLQCPSDLQKHIRKHEKPFRCDVPGCSRDKGFINLNDLDRHKKSKHFKGLYGKTKSYKCVGKGCKKPEKIWPRLDNFRNHVSKMHPKEDLDAVVAESEISVNDNLHATAVDALVNDITDNSVAQISTEAQSIDLAQARENRSIETPDVSSALYEETLSSSRSRVATTEPAYSASTGLDVLSTAAILTTSAQSAPQRYLDPLEGLTVAVTAFVTLVQQIQDVVVNHNGLGGSSHARSTNSSTSAPHYQETQHSSDVSPRIDAANSVIINHLEAMINTLKQKSSSSNGGGAAQRIADPLAPIEAATHICECGLDFKRACDLNKHMKRHTKPYGCTFSSCDKSFGSKNDWKRHENSQHFQSEFWKCQVHFAGVLFDRCPYTTNCEDALQRHLKQIHRMDQDQIVGQLEVSHAGRNNQGRFWCGFCGKMVKLESTANAAWDERFNHIDNHFTKEGKSIDDWVDAFLYKTKRAISRKIQDSDNVDDEANSPTSAPTATSLPASNRDAQKPRQNKRPAPSDELFVPPSSSSKKLKLTNNSNSIDEIYMTCCKCNESSLRHNSPARCTFCGESWCPQCDREELPH